MGSQRPHFPGRASKPSSCLLHAVLLTTLCRGRPEVQKRVFDEWDLKGTEPLMTDCIEAGVEIRTTAEELKEIRDVADATPHCGARAYDVNLGNTDKYVEWWKITAGIWNGNCTILVPESDELWPQKGIVLSNMGTRRHELKYEKKDIESVENWTFSMAPMEDRSIVDHGALDECFNIHSVKGIKFASLSFCPDNTGCNTDWVAHVLAKTRSDPTGFWSLKAFGRRPGR
ncbi:hypothetical protein MFIFM68171_10831 [Madurella fahalii]|uniref:Uncharacterized protein n=1 Tax=Madurella fahalii TaxID=1157608 RepID=A0ABQ0GSA7_9PEZI